MIDIVIITYKRLELLKNLLESLTLDLNQTESFDSKIHVLINGYDHETKLFINSEYPDINLIESEQVFPAQARNNALESCHKEWTLFLDDDVIIPHGYFKKSLNFINDHSNVDVFGGPDQVYPNASLLEKSISLALLSPLATATTRHRHTKNEEKIVTDADESKLILCHLWFKTSLFKDESFEFDNRFFRNEENVLIHQLNKANKNIFYIPDLYVHHKKKENLFHMCRSIFNSAHYRCKSMKLYKDSLNPLFIIPSVFVLYLISLIFIDTEIYYLPLYLYIVLLLGFSFLYTKNDKSLKVTFFTLVIQFLINFSYGLGFISPRPFRIQDKS